MHGRSRMTIWYRPSHPYCSGGRGTSGFHQARSAVRCSASRMKGELYPSKNRSYGRGGGICPILLPHCLSDALYPGHFLEDERLDGRGGRGEENGDNSTQPLFHRDKNGDNSTQPLLPMVQPQPLWQPFYCCDATYFVPHISHTSMGAVYTYGLVKTPTQGVTETGEE